MTKKEKIWLTIIGIIITIAFLSRANYCIETGSPMFDNVREVRIVK